MTFSRKEIVGKITERASEAERAPVITHLSLATLVAAHENHYRKPPASVTKSFFAFRGCPLTRTFTVYGNIKVKKNKQAID